MIMQRWNVANAPREIQYARYNFSPYQIQSFVHFDAIAIAISIPDALAAVAVDDNKGTEAESLNCIRIVRWPKNNDKWLL